MPANLGSDGRRNYPRSGFWTYVQRRGNVLLALGLLALLVFVMSAPARLIVHGAKAASTARGAAEPRQAPARRPVAALDLAA